jgi:queuine/archaeosine tRNA-ribosyltransferase
MSNVQVNNHVSWRVEGPKGEVIGGLMPGFPVAFLIAKDVVRVTHSGNSSAETKQADAASAVSSGGFLCFSYSQSSSSKSSSRASNFQAYENGYIIKIPGPQVSKLTVTKRGSPICPRLDPQVHNPADRLGLDGAHAHRAARRFFYPR